MTKQCIKLNKKKTSKHFAIALLSLYFYLSIVVTELTEKTLLFSALIFL